MNRDEAKQLLPIIQAFAEGKPTEFYSTALKKWEPVCNPDFSWHPSRYRIKPETIKIEYRRFIHKHPSKNVFSVVCVNTEAEVFDVELWSTFVRWIDHDWITEEVEINNEPN